MLLIMLLTRTTYNTKDDGIWINMSTYRYSGKKTAFRVKHL